MHFQVSVGPQRHIRVHLRGPRGHKGDPGLGDLGDAQGRIAQVPQSWIALVASGASKMDPEVTLGTYRHLKLHYCCP